MSKIEELLKKNELFKVLRRPTDYIRVGNYFAEDEALNNGRQHKYSRW